MPAEVSLQEKALLQIYRKRRLLKLRPMTNGGNQF
jgi:hypothetical protein